MQLQTSAFAPNADVPVEFTCDGANISPPLAWTAPPEGTQSLALVVDDPDAPRGTWVHWVVYNLPPTARQLPEAVAPRGPLASGAQQGRNDFGEIGYGGPCPPAGRAHRYYFRLFALDRRLDLPAGCSRAELDEAMRDHILSRAEMIGRYRRQP